jgi:hypothetical protein
MIDACLLTLVIVAIDGAIMTIGIPGVNTNQIGEWIAFFGDFFVRFQLARILSFSNEEKRL